MKSLARAVGFGVLVWLLPLVIAFCIFPIRQSWRSLFESIMAVVVCATTVVFGLVFLRSFSTVRARDGLWLGCLWWVICVLLDAPLFAAGPMRTSPIEYFADIGLTYLAIPVITIGLAIARTKGHELAAR
jgi:hypothetical protein